VSTPSPEIGRKTGIARFGVFEADLDARELRKQGRRLRLQDQPFAVLAILLERSGNVISRDELRQRLWPADTFVDFDHSLNTAVKKLRQALDDDTKSPRFIETLPKRGYRFIGTLEPQAKLPAPFPSSAGLSAEVATKSSWVGRVARVSAEGEPAFALVSADEESAAERERLDAASDDVGLSLLIAAQKLFLLAAGTPVRILEVQEAISRCQVRILGGEHYGKTALVPLKWLTGLA